MDTSNPARLYCTLVGAALIIAGILGFLYSSGFDTGASGVASDSDDLLGFLSVNGWANLVHIALGILALSVASSRAGARAYCLGIGAVYVVLAIWGFADSDGIVLGLLPLNDGENVLHLVLGLTGLAAGAATPALDDRDRTVRTA